MKKLTAYITIALAATPIFVFAQLTHAQGLIDASRGIVRTLIVLAAGVALLVFFFGLVKFITKADDEEAVKEGRRLMIWGVIALFVMISVWGIVRLLQSELLPGGTNFAPPPGLTP